MAAIHLLTNASTTGAYPSTITDGKPVIRGRGLAGGQTDMRDGFWDNQDQALCIVDATDSTDLTAAIRLWFRSTMTGIWYPIPILPIPATSAKFGMLNAGNPIGVITAGDHFLRYTEVISGLKGADRVAAQITAFATQTTPLVNVTLVERSTFPSVS